MKKNWFSLCLGISVLYLISLIYIVKISDANISVIKNVNDFKEVILQNSKDIRIIDLRDTSNGKGNAHHQAEQFMMNINMKLLIWDAAN